MVGFLRCCIVGLLSLSVLAVEAAPRQKPVVRPASTQDQFKKGQTTLDIDRHWGEVIDIPASGYTSSARVNVPVVQKSKYGWARIKSIAKFAIKANPARYVATAAVTYAISKIPGGSVSGSGTLVKAPPSSPPSTFVKYYRSQDTNQTTPFPTELAACKANTSTISAEFYVSSGYCYRMTSYETKYTMVGQIYASYTYSCPYGHTFPACNPAPSGEPLPFQDSDYDSLVNELPGAPDTAWDEFGPELLADVPASFDGPDGSEFTGPASLQGSPTVTTSTDIGTGNTTVTESIPSFTFDYSTDPLSITTNTTVTNNTYENGIQTSTSTSVQTSPSTGVETVPEIEVPTDCDFMPTVCSFIDWVKDPFQEEEPDLSDLISDDDFQKNIDFSSNASCPSPSIMATSQGSFEFSWQPACQWAGMVKPFIIIAALLAAIFINLGAIRGPN